MSKKELRDQKIRKACCFSDKLDFLCGNEGTYKDAFFAINDWIKIMNEVVTSMNAESPEISGYRKLSEDELKSINVLKRAELYILEIVVEVLQADSNTDKKWLDIGKTDIQKGFMALTRSIAKPESIGQK